MGGNAASKLPIPDDRMIATIEHLRLEKENLVKLHKKFHKYDKVWRVVDLLCVL